MEVISPPSEFYPDLAGLRKTLGKERSEDDKKDTIFNRGRYGESDLAFQTVPRFQFPHDVSINGMSSHFCCTELLSSKPEEKNACFLKNTVFEV